MKKIFILLLITISFGSVFSQSFLSNNSGLVSLKDGALLSVQGSVFIENNGIFDNSDTIKLTQDWVNNAGNTGFSTFDKGYVYLRGNDQRIRGNDETHFFNLLNKNTGIKFGDLDVYVDGFLDLDSLEFNLDTNIVYVTSGDVTAVRNDDGFVSSLENGGISRVTNTADEYMFPVGSSIYGTIYRPISLTTTNAPQTYRARFVNDDATNDNLDRDNRALLICDINGDFYHRIWQDMGADSSDIKFYFKANVDGTQWNDIVHWEGEPRWEKAPADTLVNGSPWDVLEVNNWNNYNSVNFAMAFTKEHFADAGPDQTIYLLDTVAINGSGGDFYTWEPSFAVECDNCPNTVFWDDSTQTMILTVEDFDNCKDVDTMQIKVNERADSDGPFIPDGISPNGDGVNDFWYIRWLYRFPDNEVIIVNRWEDIVYQSKPYNNDWYGTYNGKTLPEGTYYFILKIKENGIQTQTYTGPLTIIK